MLLLAYGFCSSQPIPHGFPCLPKKLSRICKTGGSSKVPHLPPKLRDMRASLLLCVLFERCHCPYETPTGPHVMLRLRGRVVLRWHFCDASKVKYSAASGSKLMHEYPTLVLSLTNLIWWQWVLLLAGLNACWVEAATPAC